MKTSILAVAVACAAFFSAPCFAGDFTGCAAEEIVVAGDQNGHVRLNCQIANLPACASQSWVAFDKSSVAGKQYLAMIVYAQSVGAKLEGNVAQTCSPFQGNVALLIHLRVTR